MLGLKRGTVALVNHDKEWEVNAKETIAKLKTLFGDVAADVQHIGSTSVRHIKAKPIIDIAVAVRRFEDVVPLIPELAKAGFLRRSEGDDGRQMFFVCGDFENDIRTHHIHVVLENSKEWTDYINFRDYLNAKPRTAKRYEKTKMELLQAHPKDREAYREGKAGQIAFLLRKAYVWSLFDRDVTVRVERPVGFVPPERPDISYPVNFGYVEGEDGRRTGAYVLGVKKPLEEFSGRVIGIVHRLNGDEDMLVTAPAGSRFHQAQIEEQVRFYEGMFDIRIESKYHKSCGAVVYRTLREEPEYLLLFQRGSKTWSFPKGHAEPGESERDTAEREVFEETGLTVALDDGFREEVRYSVSPCFEKKVVLFLAKGRGDIRIRESEILEFRWVTADKAKRLLTEAYAHAVESARKYLRHGKAR